MIKLPQVFDFTLDPAYNLSRFNIFQPNSNTIRVERVITWFDTDGDYTETVIEDFNLSEVENWTLENFIENT